jgi:hypothetical protein
MKLNIQPSADQDPDPSVPEEVCDDGSGSYEAYAEYSKNLRTWFVGFGIGGPVLILSNAGIYTAIKTNSHARTIFGAFALGIFLQILLAVVNKYTNWANYLTAQSGDTQSKLRGFCYWLGAQIWIDLLVDALSALAFLTAAYQLLQALAVF